MRANERVQICGASLALVPYCVHHVEKYHQWMKSVELQELTGSEPLSLQEEYEMQQSWHTDDDKCTFIILAGPEPSKGEVEGPADDAARMAGDVNLFFNDQDDSHTAEIEIMVAESSSRRKGYGQQALLLLVAYAVDTLKVTKLVAKIGLENTASLALFDKIGFATVSECDYFKQRTLELATQPAAAGSGSGSGSGSDGPAGVGTRRSWAGQEATYHEYPRADAHASQCTVSFIQSKFTSRVDYDEWRRTQS